jgi:hypothetical protein
MKRIIKNEFLEYKKFNSKNMEILQIGENTQRIHPITLNWIDNSKSSTPLCITKPNFEKDNLTIYKDYKCTNNQVNKYNSYLYTPPIGVSAEDLIKIYNLESIESLQAFVFENINNINILTINRLINCWIRINFETIKTYNNFLEKIYKKMLDKYYGFKNIEELNKLNLDKELKDFIDYWFAKNNSIGFKFNLFFDLINYLEKLKK